MRAKLRSDIIVVKFSYIAEEIQVKLSRLAESDHQGSIVLIVPLYITEKEPMNLKKNMKKNTFFFLQKSQAKKGI